jgi:type IV secretion system protein VirD4
MNLPAFLRNAIAKPGAPQPRGGVYLGWGSEGPVLARPDEHLLVIGPPRSGKTTRLLAFSVFCHPGAVVATSTKPDIIALTSWARERLGRAWFWGPSGTMAVPEGMEELRWSPVVGCSDFDEAVARAYALSTAARPSQSAHDAHWTERAQALLAPLLHAAALEGEDISGVLSWLHRHQLLEPTTVLHDNGSDRAAELLEGIARTEARERPALPTSTPPPSPGLPTPFTCVPPRQPRHCTRRWLSHSSTRSEAPSTKFTPGRRCCSHWTSWRR